jgi:hypothetical protein
MGAGALIIPPDTTGSFQTDTLTVAVNGQTAIPLSTIPIDNADVILIVNGVIYLQGLDYTIAFAVVTWTNAQFVLTIGDEIQVYYQVS